MKLLSAFVTLLLASAEGKKLRVCKPPSEACKATSEEDIQFCQNFIAQNKVCVKRCEAPGPTVTTTLDRVTTTTEVVQNPAVTKVTTVTITHTGTPTTPSTITRTATSTTITKTTEIDTFIQTVYTDSTTTRTAWTTGTATKTETALVTTTIPYEWPYQVCFRDKRSAKEKRAQVPENCSCFLTSTQSYAPTTTVTISNGQPTSTRTLYITASTTATITRTQTDISFVDGPVLATPETTKVSLVTVTQTDQTVSTITEQQTNTITKVVTSTTTTTTTSQTRATQTQSATNPCDYQDPQPQLIPEENVMLLVSNEDNTRQCCERCFSMTNCYYYSSGLGSCRIWALNEDKQFCQTDQCPNGLGRLYPGDPDGQNYYLGPCCGTYGS